MTMEVVEDDGEGDDIFFFLFLGGGKMERDLISEFSLTLLWLHMTTSHCLSPALYIHIPPHLDMKISMKEMKNMTMK